MSDSAIFGANALARVTGLSVTAHYGYITDGNGCFIV